MEMYEIKNSNIMRDKKIQHEIVKFIDTIDYNNNNNENDNDIDGAKYI
jgi:hypothetical protein